MSLDEFKWQLTSIELRLSKIEHALKIAPPTPAPMPRASEGPWTQGISPAPALRRPQAAAATPAKPGNWLGIISVICFVLAAGFIVKLSIESGWLTPQRQIGMAALLGFSLAGAGFALMKSDRAYASLLPGAGIIVLYVTTFAAHLNYGLISFEAAIAMTTMVSGLCIWFYSQIRHDAYPITAAIGAYIAPAIMGIDAHGTFSLYYFLLCSMTFTGISVWMQSRVLTLVSAYLGIILTAGLDLHQDALIAGMLALHFMIFALGTYLYSVHNKLPLSRGDAWKFMPILLIFYAVEYYLIDKIHPGLAPWISLTFAAFLIGLYICAKKYFPDGLGSQSLVMAFATLVCFHSVYIELLPATARPWLFSVIMLGFALFPTQPAHKRGDAFYIPALAIFLILANEYISMVFHLWVEYSSVWLAISCAAFASIWVALVAKNNATEKPTAGQGLLIAAHLLAVLGLYRLTNEIGSLAVSASWLFYAVAVMVFAFTRKDEVMAKSALFVLAFAAGKALLYDAASAPTTVRIFCLLLTGIVLYSCGFLMRKFASWKSKAIGAAAS